jgi:hypothetical protein
MSFLVLATVFCPPLILTFLSGSSSADKPYLFLSSAFFLAIATPNYSFAILIDAEGK